MKHFYNQRNYLKPGKYRILCTREWTDGPDESFTTAEDKVSCHKCLVILIGKLEGKLVTMRSNLKN